MAKLRGGRALCLFRASNPVKTGLPSSVRCPGLEAWEAQRLACR
ncbi:hypothetical protein Agau_C200211 [Agrobacterium tumefaciens F2]|nr:hypothetical protein Agau_C200211 [Agrobacterium tumefaciens F2]